MKSRCAIGLSLNQEIAQLSFGHKNITQQIPLYHYARFTADYSHSHGRGKSRPKKFSGEKKMKKYLFIVIAAIIFLNVSSAREVSAQWAKAVRFEVEFDFRIGERLYPAGVYRLESGGAGGENILRLLDVGAKKKKGQLIGTNAAFAAERQVPRLVFRQVGREYYLTNVFLTDGKWGFAVVPSRGQREREKKLAAAKTIEVTLKN
jgi:hypothetical protein